MVNPTLAKYLGNTFVNLKAEKMFIAIEKYSHYRNGQYSPLNYYFYPHMNITIIIALVNV